MEDKISLPKIYSEAEKNRFVQDAINDIFCSIFNKFEVHVESLMTKRLLEFCNAHPAITSMDTNKLPIADCT